MNILKMIPTTGLCVLCALMAMLWMPSCSQDGGGNREEIHKKGDGHDHEEGDGHDHEEGDGHDHEEGDGHDHSEEGHDDSALHVTEEMRKSAGIAVAPVRKSELSARVSAPAEVVPTQDGKTHVGAPMAGRIVRLYVAEGASVGRGTALAEIESPAVAALQSDYLRAVAEADRAQAELRRNETLGEERIGARRSLEEARSAWRQAVAQRQSLAAQLQAAGISADELEKNSVISSRIIVRAPVAGVVARRFIAMGEYVQPDRDAFEIVNTATVWVDAQVAPERVALMRVGETATVRNKQGDTRTGKIIYIAPVADATSRAVTVRIAIDNRDNAFRPLSYATVDFRTVHAAQSLVVPRSALETEGGNYFVYREVGDEFERVQVQVGTTTEHEVELAAGAEVGWRIAVEGVFYLKSMRKSGELAEHHH